MPEQLDAPRLDEPTRLLIADALGGSRVPGIPFQAVVSARRRKLCVTAVEAPADDERQRSYSAAAAKRAAVRSRRLLDVVDWGYLDGCFWIAYDMGNAASLTEYGKHLLLSKDTSFRLLSDVARALDGAAGEGLFPHEVRPESVFVAGRGARVGDLGTARESLGEPPSTSDSDAAYVAPEVLLGEAGGRSGVYSFGALLYNFLAGAAPRRDHTRSNGHPSGPAELVPLADWRPDLPGAVDAVVAMAMADDPRWRPRSATEVYEMARRAMRGEVPARAMHPNAGRPEPRLSSRDRPGREEGPSEPTITLNWEDIALPTNPAWREVPLPSPKPRPGRAGPPPATPPAPLPKAPTPAPKAPAPAAKAPAPAAKAPAPAAKAPEAAPKAPAPAAKTPTPAPKAPAPAAKTPTPAPKAPAPAAKAPEAAPKAPAPAAKAPEAAPKAPAPAAKTPTPAPKAPAPTAKTPTPAPKAPAPTAKTPTPAPKAPAPAAKTPTPAPKAPAPAAKTRAPAAKTPAPAAKTPAPAAKAPEVAPKTPAPTPKTSAPAPEAATHTAKTSAPTQKAPPPAAQAPAPKAPAPAAKAPAPAPKAPEAKSPKAPSAEAKTKAFRRPQKKLLPAKSPAPEAAAAPAQRAASPAQGAVPAKEAAPTKGAAPTKEAAPVKDAAPTKERPAAKPAEPARKAIVGKRSTAPRKSVSAPKAPRPHKPAPTPPPSRAQEPPAAKAAETARQPAPATPEARPEQAPAAKPAVREPEPAGNKRALPKPKRSRAKPASRTRRPSPKPPVRTVKEKRRRGDGASSERGAARSRGPVRVVVLAAALGVGAVTGLLLGGSNDQQPARTERLNTAGMSVTLPPGWRSTGGAGAAVLAARGPAESDAALDVRLVDERIEAGERSEPVQLGSLEAWRDGTSGAVRFVAPTTAGKLVIACRAGSAAGPGSLRLCERTASTLRLRTAQALPLAGVVAVEDQLSAAIARLREERATARARLAKADRPNGQRLAAEALARIHKRAGAVLAKLAAAEGIAAAARDSAAAYTAMAAAAERGAGGRWDSARQRVRTSETTLTETLAARG